jgi:hypothetical protein
MESWLTALRLRWRVALPSLGVILYLVYRWMKEQQRPKLTAGEHGTPKDGCCAFFMKRKQRFCRMRPSDGGRYCTRHEPGALEQARQASLSQQADFKENGSSKDANKKATKGESRISSSQKRMKNPLGIKYLSAIPEADMQWETIFDKPDKPIHIDIGCARGTMMQSLAQSNPHDFNYLGLELRPNLMVSGVRHNVSTFLQSLLGGGACDKGQCVAECER